MKNNKKIIISSVLGVIALCIITLSLTFAYWQINKNQEGENVVNTACLKLRLDNEQNDINLPKAYPISDEEGLELTPYSFTITNECDTSEDFTIGLEMLNDTTLDSKYVKYSLSEIKEKYVLGVDFGDGDFYEQPYNNEETCLSDKDWALEESYTITKSCELEEVEEEIKTNRLDKEKESENLILTNEAKEGRRLLSDVIKGHESKNFTLRLWIDNNADIGATSKTYKSKIVLSADMMEKGVLRTIENDGYESIDTKGMWKYKDSLTKIVIESSLIPKTGAVVYGPFDESVDSSNSIQSYVVCEEGDTNCIGYLQEDGGVKLNKDSSRLFEDFSKVTTIEGIENLNTSNVINMSFMFYGMRALQELNLGNNFDTSSVTNMSSMFFGMYALQNLDLGNKFDTRSVTNMNNMFFGMYALQSLNLSQSNFDTSSVTGMGGMFYNMEALEELNLGENFDTSNVINMSFMFYGMRALQELSLGENFDTSSVTDMQFMFYNMKSLQSLDLSKSNFDTSSVTNMNNMFFGMSTLKSLDLSKYNFDTSNVTNMNSMFSQMSSLQELNLGRKFDTSSVTDMSRMFFRMSSLQSLDLSQYNFDTSNVISMSWMFADMSVLQELNLGDKFDTSNVTDMNHMFFINALQELNLGSKFDTSNVTDMSWMFNNMRALQSLDLSTSNFNTSNVENMNAMFGDDTNLTTINYGSNFIHKEGASTLAMFGGKASSNGNNYVECPASKPDASVHSSWDGVSFDGL